MTGEQILEKLTEIFREVFDDDAIRLSREVTAADIPDWDSFNNINIMVAVELAFGVKFRTAEIERLQNVGDLIDSVGVKLRAV
jgi:acyl carrier protein